MHYTFDLKAASGSVPLPSLRFPPPKPRDCPAPPCSFLLPSVFLHSPAPLLSSSSPLTALSLSSLLLLLSSSPLLLSLVPFSALCTSPVPLSGLLSLWLTVSLQPLHPFKLLPHLLTPALSPGFAGKGGVQKGCKGNYRFCFRCDDTLDMRHVLFEMYEVKDWDTFLSLAAKCDAFAEDLYSINTAGTPGSQYCNGDQGLQADTKANLEGKGTAPSIRELTGRNGFSVPVGSQGAPHNHVGGPDCPCHICKLPLGSLVRLFRVVAGTQSLTDAVIKDLHHRSISFDNLHFRMRIVESWWWALVTTVNEVGLLTWLNSELARLRVPLEIKKKQGGKICKPSMDGNIAATMLACGQQLIYAIAREWKKILSRKRYDSAAADVENWIKSNIAILKELQWVDKAMHVVSYADLTAEQIRDFPCHCRRLGKCWRDTFGAGVQTFPHTPSGCMAPVSSCSCLSARSFACPS